MTSKLDRLIRMGARAERTAGLALSAALLTGAAIPTAHAAAFTYGAGPTGVYSVSRSGPADGI